MNNNCFQECYNYWESSTGNQPFWQELANRFGYESGEILRSRFKRERQKRGIYREEVTNEVKQDFSNFPKIGIIDIEMLPGKAEVWALWDQNISTNQLICDSILLGWAGKIINDPYIEADILTSKEALKRNAKRITISAYNFISKCDILVGHNIRNFDFKHLNTHFLLYGLNPIRRPMIDTLEVAKNNFRFMSNKLEFINDKLGIRNKISNSGQSLWSACGNGDTKSLETMKNYNIGDIVCTEDLYFKLRPYMNHPNLALYNDIQEPQCPCCLSQNLYYSGQAKYESIRCSDCGSINRHKTNLLSKDKRKSLLVR